MQTSAGQVLEPSPWSSTVTPPPVAALYRQGEALPEDEDVVGRVRAALSAHGPVREVRMFGGLSFMMNNRMVVSVRGDGELLVRADPARADQLLAEEGARTGEMGAGRAMSRSWISVSAEATATDEGLDFWISAALEDNFKAAGDPQTEGRTRSGPA